MEDRIDVCDRLRREGRWQEATGLRERIRRQLRAQGVSRSIAKDRAWDEMIAAFPPLAEQRDEEAEPDDDKLNAVSCRLRD